MPIITMRGKTIIVLDKALGRPMLLEKYLKEVVPKKSMDDQCEIQAKVMEYSVEIKKTGKKAQEITDLNNNFRCFR